MSPFTFGGFGNSAKTTVIRRRLVNGFKHKSFSTEELLEISGSYNSPTGVRCKCDAHILSVGTCSICGIYAGLCTCKTLPKKEKVSVY